MSTPWVARNTTQGYDVTWAEPYPLPGATVRYEVHRNCGAESNETTIVCNTTATACTVAKLCDGVRVRAVTTAGTGDYSDYASIAETTNTDNHASGSTLSTNTIAAAAGCGFIAVLLILAVVRKMGSKKGDQYLSVFDPGPADSRWEFNRDNLSLGRKLGNGAFGIVYEGVAVKIQEFPGQVRVAVKQCSGENVRTKDKVRRDAMCLCVHWCVVCNS